jgi:hypothetical protein
MRYVIVDGQVLPVGTPEEHRAARLAVEAAGLFSAEVYEGPVATGLRVFCLARVAGGAW